MEAFELDVGMTADGVVVVSHDLALNPDIARDASGEWLAGRGPTIWSMPHAALCGYDVGRLRPWSRTALLFSEQVARDGARIPTLAAVLAALPEARFTIEVKTDPAHPAWSAAPAVLADATLAVVDAAAAAGRVMVELFDWRVQRHVRRVRPEIRLAWLTRPETVGDAALWWDGVVPAGSVPEAVAAEAQAVEGGGVWAPAYGDLTRGQIDEAHRLGLQVLAWTVNRPGAMRRLIQWGVDGLITDRPDMALKLLG